jgi:pSer/pThr/pTyr-binding forkhead associated (FHA) protein
MGVRLTIQMRGEQGGSEQGQALEFDQPAILLGRDPSSQVVLAQNAVSRNHARISQDRALYFIEDLGSSYGTTVNGAPISKGEKRLLNGGDLIGIAQFDVRFEQTNAEVSPPGDGDDKTAHLARKVVKGVMKGLAEGSEPAFFRVMNGTEEGRRIEIADAHEFTLGRDATANVVLQGNLVSRRHCKVRRDWSGTHVEDLGSRNGFKLNKKRTTAASLKDRDELEIGGVRLLYVDPSEVREPTAAPSPLEDDEVERTNTIRPEDLPVPEPDPEPAPESPSPEAQVEQAQTAGPPSEAQGEPSPASPAVSDANLDAEADSDDRSEAESDHEGTEEASAVERRGLKELLDLSSPQNVVVLAIVGLVSVTALVVVIMVLVGF